MITNIKNEKIRTTENELIKKKTQKHGQYVNRNFT